MTQDEIIEMAKEANAGMLHGGGYALFGTEKIEAFAKLVAAKEREACAQTVLNIAGFKEYEFAANSIRARGEA